MTNYVNKYREFLFPEAINEDQYPHFSSRDEIRKKYYRVDMEAKDVNKGGLPIDYDLRVNEVYVDGNDNMSLIIGATGSRKTRSVIAPLICSLAKAKESMIVVDPKGELAGGTLAPYVKGALVENGYKCIHLNFRSLDSDRLNILEASYRLFKLGREEEAMSQVSNIVGSIMKRYTMANTPDPFWELAAANYLSGMIYLLFLVNQPDLKSLVSVMNFDCARKLYEVTINKKKREMNNTYIQGLESVLSQPDRTLSNIIGTAVSALGVLVQDQKLLDMFSSSTFTFEEIVQKPTCLFLVIPDEVCTYDSCVSLVISQIISFLLDKAYQNGSRLDRRVNFLVDEACNIRIPDLDRCVSAHRSRGIRYYLVVQGLAQLKEAYPKYYGTILANCTSNYFLGSEEIELLEQLSKKAGDRYDNMEGRAKPLISIQQLKNLKKTNEYTEGYYYSKGINYVTKLYDIAEIPAFRPKVLKKYVVPKHNFTTATMMFSVEDLLTIMKCKRWVI